MKTKVRNLAAVAAAVLALILSVVLFAACGGSAAGTYKFSSMTMGDETVEAGEEFMGVTIGEDYMTIELKEDGTAVVSTMGVETEGAWELDGKTLTLTVAGESMECTLSGGTITVEEDGATLELKK